MTHAFTDPDLIELNRIWPLGQQLAVPENGTIVVAGAFEGRYCHFLAELFPTARVHGYEPQGAAYEVAVRRLTQYRRVQLWNFGLSTSERTGVIGRLGTDGATLLNTDGRTESVVLRDAVGVLGKYDKIDVLLANMEGYEFALLPLLMDEMMHHRIVSMAIQFHPQYVSSQRAQRVLDSLDEYYRRAYWDWPYWTYWQRKELTSASGL